MKKKVFKKTVTILFFLAIQTAALQAQNINASIFRLAEGFVRIAEPGQLADTLNVWGDVNAPGRYIVPRGTTAHELISYARGPVQSTGNNRELDWSKLRLEVSISRPLSNRADIAQSFEFRYGEPLPNELREIVLENDYLVSLQIRRKPSFVDWLRVISSIVGTTATSIIIVDRLVE